MKRILIALLFASGAAQAQQLGPLTVEKIMRDPKWMGVAPTGFRWASNSQALTFNWNPERKERDQLYMLNVKDLKPVVTDEKTTAGFFTEPNYVYNKDKSMALFEKGSDIYLKKGTKEPIRLTNTVERESNARWMSNGNISFQKGDNFYAFNPSTGELTQLSNFIRGKKPSTERPEVKPLSAQDSWLRAQQTDLFDVFKTAARQGGGGGGQRGRGGAGFGGASTTIKEIYSGDKSFGNFALSPDGRYVTYRLVTLPQGNKGIIVPNYVTRSGYTEDIPGRTNVGEAPATFQDFVYDTQKDSVYNIHTEQIPGIKDLPDYVKDYPKQLAERKEKNEDRIVSFYPVSWNESATAGIIVANALDNKDRWILKLDGATGNLSLIDRQRDEAWIGGPGNGNISWIDNNTFYFQSEATGYAHLYTYNVATGEKKQLTEGKWEVQRVQLSKDKTTFYISGNKEHPGITHFYSLPVKGGTLTQITSMKGGNEITMSPDEKWLAINYSYMNKPWELYIQPNKPGAKAVQITKSTTPEFESYQWREPEMVIIKNRYGSDVYARVYPAKNPAPSRPAVVFVHGAGYLQNVHYWWSQYFREYMFNNMLADNGYTVIDIDYTGSSGYGRDHRTGIYRHMGGKDLTDQVDGVKLLVEKYGVNPKNVGLYGGSYGGFITLMGMFNEPDVFSAGGALRSVTDWAHYNHGYTANILNEPFNDENAYKLSSPINFAKGLKGNLLMCHGMVDDNVTFQDIVRLSQRLIELGKDNWELAVYPVESHGFTEPSSWTDEYKRIYKIFNETLKK